MKEAKGQLFSCKYAVYPVRSLNKIFAALTAIAGIMVIAMPTRIVSAVMSDAMQAR
jgi:voltage-gated potassium channel